MVARDESEYLRLKDRAFVERVLQGQSTKAEYRRLLGFLEWLAWCFVRPRYRVGRSVLEVSCRDHLTHAGCVERLLRGAGHLRAVFAQCKFLVSGQKDIAKAVGVNLSRAEQAGGNELHRAQGGLCCCIQACQLF